MARRRIAVALLALLACAALLVVGAAPQHATAQPGSPHLALGNPSGAVSDAGQPNNYLITRPQYALGYSRDDGIPRWVSWRLIASDLGPITRTISTFASDLLLPDEWRITHDNYTNSGYDRGHMTPSADRTATEADNAATFIMSNVVPQSPQNNRGSWVDLENLERTLAREGDEVYIVAGPEGEIARLAAGKVRVPATTWKGLLAVPAGTGDAAARVTTATRIIAISVPNDKANMNVKQADDWELYRTTVDAIEAATGLDLFAELPAAVQQVLEARVDVGALPYTLAISGTTALEAPAGSPFAPLAVRVTDAGGTPVAGLTVTFAALGEAANADLGGNVVATAVTDTDGVAIVTPVAGVLQGTYTLEASVAGVFTPAAFTLTNLVPPGAPQNAVYLPLMAR